MEMDGQDYIMSDINQFSWLTVPSQKVLHLGLRRQVMWLRLLSRGNKRHIGEVYRHVARPGDCAI